MKKSKEELKLPKNGLLEKNRLIYGNNKDQLKILKRKKFLTI